MQTVDFTKECEERFEACEERFKTFKKTNKLSVNKKEPIICDGCQKPIIKNEQYLLRILHCGCRKITEKIPLCYCNNCAKEYLTKDEYNNLYNKDDSHSTQEELCKKCLKILNDAHKQMSDILKELNKIAATSDNQKNKGSFLYNGKEVTWDDLPLEIRKKEYPYYFDEAGNDCYPVYQR